MPITGSTASTINKFGRFGNAVESSRDRSTADGLTAGGEGAFGKIVGPVRSGVAASDPTEPGADEAASCAFGLPRATRQEIDGDRASNPAMMAMASK